MIRVLVVDDHEWVSDGVASVLDAADGMEVVGTGADGPAALVEAERLRPDVITLDVSMPGMDGLRTAELLRLRHPGVGSSCCRPPCPGRRSTAPGPPALPATWSRREIPTSWWPSSASRPPGA
ncbi:MAG: two-component system, NarL family, response regulator DesR, partial [Pseudonocardiales bacterium]|nr:two-component system, NarL family, response regulator DesR [Pseudonocardiales bacterium]